MSSEFREARTFLHFDTLFWHKVSPCIEEGGWLAVIVAAAWKEIG
jgi:hypothetical protein